MRTGGARTIVEHVPARKIHDQNQLSVLMLPSQLERCSRMFEAGYIAMLASCSKLLPAKEALPG